MSESKKISKIKTQTKVKALGLIVIIVFVASCAVVGNQLGDPSYNLPTIGKLGVLLIIAMIARAVASDFATTAALAGSVLVPIDDNKAIASASSAALAYSVAGGASAALAFAIFTTFSAGLFSLLCVVFSFIYVQSAIKWLHKYADKKHAEKKDAVK